jgi:hypothetical protein
VFLAAAMPAAAVETLSRLRPPTAPRRRLTLAALAALLVFFAYATVMNCRDIYKWSDRKVVSNDWFALRDASRSTLKGAPVLIETATFRMAFFHGMWAAYFLPESRLYYGARGEESGGYLRAYVVNEATAPIPTPAAVLVGRPWADSIDANSPRLLTGREYALVGRSNRVSRITGVWPTNGRPDHFRGEFSLEILPHSPSDLVITIAPTAAAGWPAGDWRVRRTAPGTPDFTANVQGASPWTFRIPLVAGQPNVISGSLAGASNPSELSFIVRTLRVEDRP